VAWVGSCALIAAGLKFFNSNSKILGYLNRASFPVYILHQSILVAVGYYALRSLNGLFLQAVTIMSASFLLTIALYELVKRIPFVKTLIAIK
jgi:peptidoglycan/LPS O-acetylase OafA/YrhL